MVEIFGFRCVAYLRRNNNHVEAFELNQYLNNNLGETNLDESSSSENESEDSEVKSCVGDDVNLDEITGIDE